MSQQHFPLRSRTTRRDLLDPAVGGATAVLEASKRYGPSIRRVVNTSSFAAICDFSQGFRPGYTYTEKDWNLMTYDHMCKPPTPTPPWPTVRRKP
jgi:nucleoside-diphosphate-sugar epimerase